MNSQLREVKEDNDSLFFLKILNMLGVNQSQMMRLLGCSNVVNHWAMGYRKIPSSFKRFILIIRFIQELDLMPQLLQYIKQHEREGWGSSDIKDTNWLKMSGVNTNLKKGKRKC